MTAAQHKGCQLWRRGLILGQAARLHLHRVRALLKVSQSGEKLSRELHLRTCMLDIVVMRRCARDRAATAQYR